MKEYINFIRTGTVNNLNVKAFEGEFDRNLSGDLSPEQKIYVKKITKFERNVFLLGAALGEIIILGLLFFFFQPFNGIGLQYINFGESNGLFWVESFLAVRSLLSRILVIGLCIFLQVIVVRSIFFKLILNHSKNNFDKINTIKGEVNIRSYDFFFGIFTLNRVTVGKINFFVNEELLNDLYGDIYDDVLYKGEHTINYVKSFRENVIVSLRESD